MDYNNSPHGLVEIHCTGCGASLGRFPYNGFRTVSSCGQCEAGDGFVPPPEWPTQNKFLGRDVGTTQDDLIHMQPVETSPKPGPKEDDAEKKKEPVKKKRTRRTWMNKRDTQDE